MEKAPGFAVPKLQGKAVVHAHCHHNAIMKLDCDSDLLKRSGLDFNILNSGCCGMAGYFGYERGSHYDVSVKCGERVLLPAVREADENTLIIADGFSCREQIEQQTDRKALHMAEVLHMALRQRQFIGARYPERYVERNKLRKTGTGRTIVLLSVFAAGILAVVMLKSKKNEIQTTE
jgi:hypothetical protein